MDKQEAKEKIINSSWHWIGRPDKSVSVDLVLDIIDDIDVQEPPAIPEIPHWLAERIEEYNIDSSVEFWRYVFNGSIFNPEERAWILDNDDAINKIFLYGWTVKESLWVIKTPPYRDSYFKSFLEEEYAKIKINFNHTVRGKATKFTDKDKAEAVATLTGGTVEEMERVRND